eukprot:419923-Amphidinium_carterae.1
MVSSPDSKSCWAAMPAEAIPSKSDLHRSFALTLSHAQKGLRVLDLGCGDGRITLGLLDDSHEVVGVDCNEEAIRAAEARAAEVKDRISFFVGDVCEVDLSATPFDV